MPRNGAGIMGAMSILTTKIRVPSLRPALIARERLHALLERGLGLPLTLVIAPAGFGKTTLVSQWLTLRAEGVRLRADAAQAQPSALNPQPSTLNPLGVPGSPLTWTTTTRFAFGTISLRPATGRSPAWRDMRWRCSKDRRPRPRRWQPRCSMPWPTATTCWCWCSTTTTRSRPRQFTARSPCCSSTRLPRCAWC
jgi:hypothetical protein